MTRSWVALAIVSLLPVFFPGRAMAQGSSCPGGEPPVAFWGRALGVADAGGGLTVTTFQVERVYRGQSARAGKKAWVLADPRGEGGITFEPGRAYLVRAIDEGGALRADACAPPRPEAAPPLGLGQISLAPAPPGAGSVRERLERARAVFVGRIARRPRGLSGALEFEVERAYKGAERGSTVRVVIDRTGCPGKARGLLGGAGQSEDPFSIGQRGTPSRAPAPPRWSKGDRALVFGWGDEPLRAQPCHDNLARLPEAAADEASLRALCAQSACDSIGATVVAAADKRASLRAAIAQQAEAAASACREAGVLELRIEARIAPSGAIGRSRASASGSVEQKEPYAKTSSCALEEMRAWTIPPFPGDEIGASIKVPIDEKGDARPARVELSFGR